MANAYGAGATGQQGGQFREASGINQKLVELSINSLCRTAEEFTMDTISKVQAQVIDTLIHAWMTPDGAEHIQKYTEWLNTLTNEIASGVRRINDTPKDTAEQYSQKAFNHQISIAVEYPQTKTVSCEGVKTSADDGTILVMTDKLKYAKGFLSAQILPKIDEICEDMKWATRNTGLYDYDNSLQNEIDTAVSGFSTKMKDCIENIINHINVGIDYQSDAADQARSFGAQKLSEMHSSDFTPPNGASTGAF